MLEFRIHGRGGQGNVVAAYLLASAAIGAGFYAQAFPAFGAERRGAPVAAFVRVRRTPIQRRCEVEHPDFVVVQDATLLQVPATLGGLTADGGVVVNSGRGEESTSSTADGHSMVQVPATGIAEQEIGRAIPNVPLLGALLALTELIPMDALYDALAERFDARTAQLNRQAADAAARLVTGGAWREYANAQVD